MLNKDLARHTALLETLELSNGYMSFPAIFEERYVTAHTAQRANIFGIDVVIGQSQLNLKMTPVDDFTEELDVCRFAYRRSFSVTSPDGKRLRISSERLLSMADVNVAYVAYTVRSDDYEGVLQIVPYIESRGEIGTHSFGVNRATVETAEADKSISMQCEVRCNNRIVDKCERLHQQKRLSLRYVMNMEPGDVVTGEKLYSITGNGLAEVPNFTERQNYLRRHWQTVERKKRMINIEVKGRSELQQALEQAVYVLTSRLNVAGTCNGVLQRLAASCQVSCTLVPVLVMMGHNSVATELIQRCIFACDGSVEYNLSLAFGIIYYVNYTADERYVDSHAINALVGIVRSLRKSGCAAGQLSWVVGNTLDYMSRLKIRSPHIWVNIQRVTALSDEETAEWQQLAGCPPEPVQPHLPEPDGLKDMTVGNLDLLPNAALWLSVVQKVCQPQVQDGVLTFQFARDPEFDETTVNFFYRGHRITVSVEQSKVGITQEGSGELSLKANGRLFHVNAGERIIIDN